MLKLNRKTKVLAGLTALLPSFFASADVTLNGFASIRGGLMNYDNAPPNLTRMYNMGIESGSFSLKQESLFGVQARAELSDGLSATVQFVGEGVNDFDVEARWAYISYEINSDHTVNAGRLVNPIFYQSEYEIVGFAHRFARLPKAVYFGFDFSTIEGISLDSTFYIGDYRLLTKVLYGNWDGDTFIASAQQFSDLRLDDLFSLRAELESDHWSIYLGGFTAVVNSNGVDQIIANISGLTDPARFGNHPDAARLMQGLQFSGKDSPYVYAGFKVDYMDWLVDFEYASVGASDSADAFNDGWFLAVGRRFGDLTVTVHTEELKQDPHTDWTNGVSPDSEVYQRGVIVNNALAAFGFEMTTLTMRYDFHPSAALKLDYFAGTHDSDAVGDYDGFSVGVDLVF